MKKAFRIIAVILAVTVMALSFTACASQSKKLTGKWADSAGLTGYEFKEDGTVVVTLANFTIPIINQNFNGKIEDGVYTTSKTDGVDYVTISYKVLTFDISKTYKYIVDKSTLTLTDTDNNTQLTYFLQSAE